MAVQLIDRVVSLYRRMDALTGKLQAASGLGCPRGCGECCRSREVEASVLEMLPAGLELCLGHDAEHWLQRAAEAGEAGQCVFFQPDRLCYGHGCCAMYPWRPLVCRLFGFAAVRDRRENSQLVACRILREAFPERVRAARELLEGGFRVASFVDWAERMAALEPGWGVARLPINRALQAAIQRIGLVLRLERADPDDSSGPTHFPPPRTGGGSRPRRPRRAA